MPSRRIDLIDTLRGLALVWMTIFHFCYDLNEFGYLHQDFHHDRSWTLQRTAILSAFLLCAGMGQAVALQQRQDGVRFWRRWAQVAAGALLVTLGSWWMFPRSFIYFGVLHGVVVMLILARLTAPWGSWLWPLGLIAMLLPQLATQALQDSSWESALNGRWLNWLGWITHKPVTEDYVPVLPWMGMVWWGVATGQWLLRQPRLRQWQASGGTGGLAALGRWSLTYYLLHQPLMIGALMLVGALLHLGLGPQVLLELR